jgi:hypothetical protein
MKLPRQGFKGMEIEPERTHFCFCPVDDTGETACGFVDHDVAGAEVSVEEDHWERHGVVERVDAGLHDGLKPGRKCYVQESEVPEMGFSQAAAVLWGDFLRSFPRESHESGESQSGIVAGRLAAMEHTVPHR